MAMWAAPIPAPTTFVFRHAKRQSAMQPSKSAMEFFSSCRPSSRVLLVSARFPISLRSSFQDVAIQNLEEGGTQHFVAETAQNEDEDKSQLSQQALIWRAIKLPIYSVALVPLTVGSAAAFYKTNCFNAGRFGILLGSAVLVIAWLNLSNDAYDAETGVDIGKKESVVNLTGSRERVLTWAYACLALGISGLMWVCWKAQNMQAFTLEAAAITCGYIYQCPPFRLSYLGLGEPLCFTAFGPLVTTAFYLSQQFGSLPICGTILAAATLVGITTTLILFCSHFHQIEGDKSVGKLSPLVRLGTERGKEIVKLSVMGLYILTAGFTFSKVLPYPCAILTLLTTPLGKMIIDYVTLHHRDKEKIFLAKYYCVRLHAAFGAALSLGFVFARQMAI